MEDLQCCGEMRLDENSICRNCGAPYPILAGGQGRSTEDVSGDASLLILVLEIATWAVGLGFLVWAIVLASGWLRKGS